MAVVTNAASVGNVAAASRDDVLVPCGHRGVRPTHDRHHGSVRHLQQQQDGGAIAPRSNRVTDPLFHSSQRDWLAATDSRPRATNRVPQYAAWCRPSLTRRLRGARSGATMARHPRCLGASPLAPLAGTGRDPGAVPTGHRVVDGLTKHAHLVSSDELAASWVRGDYRACCGGARARSTRRRGWDFQMATTGNFMTTDRPYEQSHARGMIAFECSHPTTGVLVQQSCVGESWPTRRAWSRRVSSNRTGRKIDVTPL